MMDLYQLRTFYTFGKIGNFTKTADALFITQSAVSHSLKKLEQSLGTKLFKKQGKEYTLTGVGEELFRRCERIFLEIEKFEESVAAGDGQIKQKICLGAPVEFGTTVLIKKMAEFFNSYPHIHVDFLFSNDLRSALERDEVDLVVDCKGHHGHNLDIVFLFEEHYVVIASPGYVETHGIEEVKDLERVTVLSLDKNGDWWNNFLLGLSIDDRPTLRTIMRVNHVRGLINGAISGIGVSFVPRYTVEMELEQGVLTDVFGGLAMDDRFCIYIKKERKEFEKNRHLMDFLVDTFAGFEA